MNLGLLARLNALDNLYHTSYDWKINKNVTGKHILLHVSKWFSLNGKKKCFYNIIISIAEYNVTTFINDLRS